MPDDAGMDPESIRHLSGTIRHTPDELVPLAEGARRLGLAHDTARKHLTAGTLRAEKRQGRWWVWVPMSDDMPDASGTGPAPSGTMPDAVIARLESEVTFLRSELESRTEEIRRRDHIIAGLVESMRVLPAGTAAQTMPQERAVATERDVQPMRASETLIDRLRRLIGR
jgi:hypothetical protein